MMRRSESTLISQSMSLMRRSTVLTWCSSRRLPPGFTDIGEVVGDLELDQHVVVARILAQHGAMPDTLGDEQHVAGMHDLHAHLSLPFQRPLHAEDDLVGIDVAVPEAHVMLAALGDVDLDAIGGIK